MFDFGRELCGDLSAATQREWLVTNGMGGFASGTVAGVLTRRYHALLVAALTPPVGRTVLVSKLDEVATYDGQSYPLFSNCWEPDAVEPAGWRYLQRFHLDGTTPVWAFACADALLEKRVWMQPGAHTTYIRYTLLRASTALELSLKALVNYRDHHTNTHTPDWDTQVVPLRQGLEVRMHPDATPFYLLSAEAVAQPQHTWVRDLFLAVEDYRGYDAFDDVLDAGHFHATLAPGDAVTIVASLSPEPELDAKHAYAERRAHEADLWKQAGEPEEAPVRQLVLAADQFIVTRTLPDDPDGRTIIAGYPWFTDWGRDTMISLPGLTLSTGRHEVARRILRTFARFVDQGMLPNRFPDSNAEPEYNTVDATLWYFEALRAYYAATGDDELLRALFPVLRDVVAWHRRGTRYHIHVDLADGLLYAGEPGVQLTWMDVKVEDWVVTPRTGKPVEINALWYHALCVMADFAERLQEPVDEYTDLAVQVRASFARFWNADLGCCYDVIDGPAGDDPALRPNQLFAVSLLHSPLEPEQQRAVVDSCARYLLTSHGLRSLAPEHPEYVGHYGGDLATRDAAYHQGTVWGWLLGPFVKAHLRVYRDPGRARAYIAPLLRHLAGHAVGSISEIFDGDPPFTPRGCFAQAWSVAELLHVYKLFQS